MNKKYIRNVGDLSSKIISKDQKKLIIDFIKIMDQTNNNDYIDSIYKLLMRRVKTGFVFENSLEFKDDQIGILVESKEFKPINEKLNNQNSLIIGDDYSLIKNLLITHRNKIDMIYVDSINDENKYENNKFSSNGWLNQINEKIKLSKELLSMGGDISNNCYWWESSIFKNNLGWNI